MKFIDFLKIKNRCIQVISKVSKLNGRFLHVSRPPPKTEEDALKYLGIKSKRNKKNKKSSKKSDSGIVNLNIQSKDNKSNSFKVQISDELYNDFIEKCIEKHLSKDMILGFIINQWTYDENQK